jgi:hypothetical protein
LAECRQVSEQVSVKWLDFSFGSIFKSSWNDVKWQKRQYKALCQPQLMAGGGVGGDPREPCNIKLSLISIWNTFHDHTTITGYETVIPT